METSRGRGLWKSCETLHMVLWKLLNICGWIFARLGRLSCWISRNTLLWHITAQLVSAQQNETLLWLVGMNYVKFKPIARFKIWWHKIVKQGITYWKHPPWSHHRDKFCDDKYCKSLDLMLLICCVKSRDQVVKGLCDLCVEAPHSMSPSCHVW